jgi:hypothetical protein
MNAPEPFVVNSTAGNSAPFGGRRHHKLRLVTKKVARKHLKKMGLKMRGGGDEKAPVAMPEEALTASEKAVAPAVPAAGGRRHRSKKHTRRHRRSVFGLKY